MMSLAGPTLAVCTAYFATLPKLKERSYIYIREWVQNARHYANGHFGLSVLSFKTGINGGLMSPPAVTSVMLMPTLFFVIGATMWAYLVFICQDGLIIP